jgi:hypothetical protein
MATRRSIGTVKTDCIARAFEGWPLGRELLPVEALRTSAEREDQHAAKEQRRHSSLG